MTSGLLLALIGCGPSGHWAGYYKGQIEPNRPLADPIDGTHRRVELEIKTDGTFSMVTQGFPISGDAGIAGAHADFTPRMFMNQPFDRQPDDMKTALSGIHADKPDDDHVNLCWGPSATCVLLTRSVKP